MYQGKVALYHSIKILQDGAFKGKSLKSFDLQLDSTDDFAIYVGSTAISVHQVKGKCSEYRSTFVKDLIKSALISFDCTSTTSRFFHIANNIDDASDYTSPTGEIVEFYDYDGVHHCPLSEVEIKTKERIEAYLLAKGMPSTPILLESKYSALSSLIAKHVVKCHSLVHTGSTQNEAAYTERIPSELLKSILETDFHKLPDADYKYYQLKKIFADTFEDSIASGLSQYSILQVDIFEKVFRYIYAMDNASLRPLVDSFLPSEKDEFLRRTDVEVYAEIVTTITHQIVLKGLPHFSRDKRRYLPTAINIRPKQVNTFADELVKHIRSNDVLANVLFEYNTLIGFCDGMEVRASSDKITSINTNRIRDATNIIQEFPITILSVPTAIDELDA